MHRLEKGCSCRDISIGNISSVHCDSVRAGDRENMSRFIMCLFSLIPSHTTRIIYRITKQHVFGDGVEYDPIVTVTLDDEIIATQEILLDNNEIQELVIDVPISDGEHRITSSISEFTTWNPETDIVCHVDTTWSVAIDRSI